MKPVCGVTHEAVRTVRVRRLIENLFRPLTALLDLPKMPVFTATSRHRGHLRRLLLRQTANGTGGRGVVGQVGLAAR
jgi:hypothetical protein